MVNYQAFPWINLGSGIGYFHAIRGQSWDLQVGMLLYYTIDLLCGFVLKSAESQVANVQTLMGTPKLVGCFYVDGPSLACLDVANMKTRYNNEHRESLMCQLKGVLVSYREVLSFSACYGRINRGIIAVEGRCESSQIQMRNLLDARVRIDTQKGLIPENCP
jgi:hypothetical protein